MTKPVEFMLSDEEGRVAFEKGTEKFQQQLDELKKQFNIVDEASWFSVSTPQFNPIYNDEVVSVVFWAKPAYLASIDTAAIGRKYFLQHGWVYDKVYTFIPPKTNELPCPDGATPMFLGYLINVYGQPGDSDLSRYKCLYFMHNDHKAVEAWANQSLPEGKYSTFYSATFDTADNNRLMRMKTYCYDEQGGFSDWDVIYFQHCKKAEKLDDLLEN